jgi:Holliday junction resolvasome RuvABC endonuclease subunit
LIGKVISATKSKNVRDARILGVDSKSTSIAVSLYERVDGEVRLLAVAKADLGATKDMSDKFNVLNEFLPAFFEKYGPIDIVVIEQTIYIQSPQTSRILSYIVGHIWGKCLEYCSNVSDIQIQTWKAFIGYKNVTKKEIAEWEKEMTKTEAKKKAQSERKLRTIRIMHDKIPETSDIDDDDIMDAVAIGYWAVCNK